VSQQTRPLQGDRAGLTIASRSQVSEDIQFWKKEPEIKQTPAPQDVEGADVEELDPAASE